MSDSQDITAGDVASVADALGEPADLTLPEGNVEGEVKGPAPEVWSDEVRAERGAERHPDAIAAEGPQFGDDGELVKGPDPQVWDDEVRAERGAERTTEQVAEQGPAIPEPWTDEEVAAAKPEAPAEVVEDPPPPVEG